MKRVLFSLAVVWAGSSLTTGAFAAADKPKAADCSCEIISAYLPLSKALAADDLKAAKTAATALAKEAGDDGLTGIVKQAQTIAGANDIAAARSTFKALSTDILPMVDPEDHDVVVMHCPMADADWLQNKGATQNPYFGKAMLSCGMPKKKT